MHVRHPVLAIALLALAACAGPEPRSRQALQVIPAPPPMPVTPIPPEGRPADLNTAYAGACTVAVFNEVPAQIPGVQRVQTDGASFTEFPAEGDLVRVGGTGRYYSGGTDWQPFEFRCLFDTARTSITDFDIIPL